MPGKELFYRKRWLVLRYNVMATNNWGGRAMSSPDLTQHMGSLSSRLWHYESFANGTMGDKPYWTRTFFFGSKRPNYMMWNVGCGGSRMWNHSWMKYKTTGSSQPYLDLRGPMPR